MNIFSKGGRLFCLAVMLALAGPVWAADVSLP